MASASKVEAKVASKNMKPLPPKSATMTPATTADKELVKGPDIVMQRKLKGNRLIGGRR